MLVHEYAAATGEQVHESALLVAENPPAFYEAHRRWISRGFTAEHLRAHAVYLFLAFFFTDPYCLRA
jgi:hypothetical protein